MATTIEATFDGTVFRPSKPISLEPNTPVLLTVETIADKTSAPTSFLRATRSLNLQGPPDWASNLDKYLYGEEYKGAR
jgi:hypothetical protein